MVNTIKYCWLRHWCSIVKWVAFLSHVDDEFKDAKDDEDIAGDDDGPGWDVDDEDLDLPDLVSYLWVVL